MGWFPLTQMLPILGVNFYLMFMERWVINSPFSYFFGRVACQRCLLPPVDVISAKLSLPFD
jgi:hypothetical protein